MSDNREKICLERIKTELFKKKDEKITSDKIFSFAEYFTFLKEDWQKKFFGVTKDDVTNILSIIYNAKANENTTFPDFIFKNGFIEHFQISSSDLSEKGGYVHAKENKKFCKNVNEQLSSVGIVGASTQCFVHPPHSYYNLKASFERTWEKHIEHLESYNGKKDVGIFLIEHPEINLQMCENKYKNWIEGALSGDYGEGEQCEYRLSRDKEMLEYIYKYKNQIQYMINIS